MAALCQAPMLRYGLLLLATANLNYGKAPATPNYASDDLSDARLVCFGFVRDPQTSEIAVARRCQGEPRKKGKQSGDAHIGRVYLA